MGSSLFNTTPQNTYPSLLKLSDNLPLNGTLKAISDGAGNDTMILISNTALQIGGTTGMFWDNTNKRLGIGTNAPTSLLTISGASGGTLGINLEDAGVNRGAFYGTSGGTNLIGYNNGLLLGTIAAPTTMKLEYTGNVGIGTTTISARTHIKGSGSTSATTSLLVQNSSATELLRVRDDGRVYIGTTGWFEPTAQSTSLYNFYSKPILTSTEGSNIVKVLISNNQHSFLSAAAGINGQIGINTSTPNASAALDITSTTTGFLPPRLSNAQRLAIATPAVGLMVYCTDAVEGIYVYKSTGWQFIV